MDLDMGHIVMARQLDQTISVTMVMKEICYITLFSVWGCVAADQSECPCWSYCFGCKLP